MTIADNRDLIGDATSLTNWSGLTGGDAPALNTETTPPGVTTVISNKVSNEVGGIIYDDGGANTFADTDTIYIWYNTIFGPLDTIAGGGVRVYFAGATTTDQFSVIVDGTDSGRSGWQLIAINIGKARLNPDFIGGTPPTAANIEQIGIQWDMTSTVGGNNDDVAIGNIYRQTNAEATYRVDAGTDGTPNTWQDIANQVLTDGTGIVIKETNGAFTLNGSIEFGPVSGDVDMTFVDTGVVLAFNDQAFITDDFYSLSMNLPGAYAGDARITAGTKVGSGETAVGVAGWTVITGGPRYTMEFENADQTDVQFYGCSFQGSGIWSIDDSSVEIISCVFSNCDQMTISGASGPTVLSNFFAAAPGPLAQIKWGNSTSPINGQFDFNSFVNMKWWGIEFDTAGSYDLRGVIFSGNGTDRDILASHNSGTVTVSVLESGSTPGGTNGATITITTAGASDIRMTAVSLDNVNQATPVETSSGAAVIDGTDPLTAAVTPDDANNYLAAVYGADVFGTIDWSGSSAYVEQVEDNSVINSAVMGGANKEGVTGAQTASADHSGTVLNAALSVINVQNEAASPVLEVDPEWRPVETTLASTTHVFGYGVPGEGTDLGAFVMVHTQDPTAADTVVSSVSWGGTTMTNEQADFADDSGGGGEGLSTAIFRLVGSNLRKGTLTIVASVSIEVNGVTEGAQCYMEADGITGPLSAGTEILNVAADSSGVASGSFSGTVPQGTIIRARSSGTVGAVLSDNSGSITNQTTFARDRQSTDDINLNPGGATNDALYIGAINKFERVNFDVFSTGGAGTYTLTWEYWNGAWTALTVVDNTGDFKNGGNNRVTFTAPGDWATTTVDSVGPQFYIRARGDGGTQTTEPKGNTISVAEGNTVKYLPFETTGTIVAGTGLTVTAVWIPDVIAS